MGTNGIPTAEILRAREKCPDAPTKRKYPTSESAWAEADERSKETGIRIVAYACPGCGYFHLTKKATGSDVVVNAPVGITTGALRKATAAVAENIRKERVSLEDDLRELKEDVLIKPGNKAARMKLLAEFLKERDDATTKEITEVIGITTGSVVTHYMREIGGWRNTGGRHAKWVRQVVTSSSGTVPSLKLAPETSSEAEESTPLAVATEKWVADRAVEREVRVGWHDFYDTNGVGHMTVNDLVDMMTAIGLEVRIQYKLGS